MEQKKEFETSKDYQEDDLPFPYLHERPIHSVYSGRHIKYDGFKTPIILDDNQLKVALRTLKHYFEEHVGVEVPDDLFIELIKLFPHSEFKLPFDDDDKDSIDHALDEYGYYHSISDMDLSTFFEVPTHNDRRYQKLILHVPHSSMLFPLASKYSFGCLDYEERLLVDYYTDDLFVPDQKGKNINALVFPYCRLYCDVERMINDPLETEGLGISYYRDVRIKIWGKRRSFSTIEEAFKLYAIFHAAMSRSITEGQGRKLLIDCHSFSNLPNLLCSNPPDIDICIGFNDDDTFPGKVVIGNMKHYFESLGYKVGINTPFSNSKTFEVPVKYHSVMIEVNKRLYMNEETLEKTNGFDSLKQDIQSLYSNLLGQAIGPESF